MNKKRNHVLHLTLCILIIAAMAIGAAFPVQATGTSKSPTRLTIATVEEFLKFAENCRLDTYSQDLEVSLDADLNLVETDFSGIPIFCGTFLGNGHTITGLNLNKEGSYQGLFRYLTSTSRIQDLAVRGRVIAKGTRTFIGGLAGSNAGSIENCSFSGIISGGEHIGGLVGINTLSGTIETCQMEGIITGDHFVGGISGENAGVIRNCTNASGINTTTEQNAVQISDITMDTLTNSESASTVTDIGGVAGTNTGVIRNSENLGQVGYQQIGYNIGGIAGSQSGYILDCTNQGSIFGRKEVGGIVGQMEPVTKITFHADTLQILREQLNTLSALTDKAAIGASNHSTALKSQVASLRDQSASASAAANQVLSEMEHVGTELWEIGNSNAENFDPEAFDPETFDPNNLLPGYSLDELPDLDSLYAAQNNLSSELGVMSETMNAITATAENAGASMSKDLEALTKQINTLENTLDNASENLGGTISDISDEDTTADVTGKLRGCKNHGSILADINVGGITGAICFENNLDPEDNLTFQGDLSLNANNQLRAVITDCENHAPVTAKKHNAGGILGWQSMGLVSNCLNTGTLDSENADFVGGISGRSSGFLRNNYVNCLISGSTCVGGIAGSGTTVTGNRSMVNILAGTEKLGAILGIVEEGESSIVFSAEALEEALPTDDTTDTPIPEDEKEIAGNYYPCLSADYGAIDGISYSDCAEPLPLEDFLSLDHLPEIFRKVRIYFHADNTLLETITVDAGDPIPSDKIPAVPEKKGHSGVWNDLHEDPVYFDLTIEAEYTPLRTTLASRETDEESRPILLIQGSFYPNAEIQLSLSEYQPPLTEDVKLAESWHFEISGEGKVTGIRCRIPADQERNTPHILRRDETGTWTPVTHSADGQYLVFAFDQTNGDFAIVYTQPPLLPWILGGSAGAIILLGAIIWLCIRRKKLVNP